MVIDIQLLRADDEGKHQEETVVTPTFLPLS